MVLTYLIIGAIISVGTILLRYYLQNVKNNQEMINSSHMVDDMLLENYLSERKKE